MTIINYAFTIYYYCKIIMKSLILRKLSFFRLRFLGSIIPEYEKGPRVRKARILQTIMLCCILRIHLQFINVSNILIT